MADSKDPEITLGTMTVLGIFFGLAVLCAGFFGFGYSVGSKRPAAAAVATSTFPQTIAGLPVCKPAPGSPAGTPVSAQAKPQPAASENTAQTTSSPEKAADSSQGATVHFSGRPINPADSKVVGDPVAPDPPAPVKTSHSQAAVAGPIAIGPTQSIVQVAALSHAADAQTVVSALKSKGYDATIHSSALDNLLHVQIGPFPSKKEAEAMQERLKADGFNAILK